MSKVWFVTGSSRGLGRALVEIALEAGDRVAATARNPERLNDLLDRYGRAVLVPRLDVTDYDAAARVVAQAKETFGRIDVVVNNAGYGDLASFEDATIDSFRTQIDTDFYGVVNVTKAVVPVLREQGSGHIFQVSSLIVRLSGAGLTAYQAAKCAVVGLSVGLAQEIAPFGVKVTVLEPGAMRTDWGGASMTIPQPSAPYQPTIGAFAESLRAFSGHEPGNTRRVAQVVRDLAGRDDAPLRLLLGTDAVPLAQQAAQDLAASDEAWREVSLSISHETPQTTDARTWTRRVFETEGRRCPQASDRVPDRGGHSPAVPGRRWS
jgi:NAD(P)-dependent dehydrogenase (short-subunit alcohol dehydrogenase family)